MCVVCVGGNVWGGIGIGRGGHGLEEPCTADQIFFSLTFFVRPLSYSSSLLIIRFRV